MTTRLRKIRSAVIWICLVGGLFAISLPLALTSAWFQNWMRQRIVSTLENASGARVEIGSFAFDWHTLTADFGPIVLHGNEPPRSKPLLEIERVRMAFQITSLLRQQLHIASLQILRPQLYLLIRADGTTNMPQPETRTGNTVDDLLKLRIEHVAFVHGSIEADSRRFPIDGQADDVSFLLSYNWTRSLYDATLSSQRVHIESPGIRTLAAGFQARLQIMQDQVTIASALLQERSLTLRMSGSVKNFRNPTAVVHVEGRMSAPDLASSLELKDVSAGQVSVAGDAHWTLAESVRFEGVLNATDLTCRIHDAFLKNIRFRSDISADKSGARFARIQGSLSGAPLTGNAVLDDQRRLTLNASFSQVQIAKLARTFLLQQLPWSGLASGSIHAAGTLNRRNWTADASLQITPLTAAKPAEGNIRLSFRQASDELLFGPSHLQLPQTQLALSGILGKRMELQLDSADLSELQPLWPLLHPANMPSLKLVLNGTAAQFKGEFLGTLAHPQLNGFVSLSHFQLNGTPWESVRGNLALSSSALRFDKFSFHQSRLSGTVSGSVQLTQWRVSYDSELHLNGVFQNADVPALLSAYSDVHLPIAQGMASGDFTLRGKLSAPTGTAHVRVNSVDPFGQLLNQIDFTATTEGDTLHIEQGRVQAGPAVLSFSADYAHAAGDWASGRAALKVDSNGFPLASLSPARKLAPALDAEVEIHGSATADLSPRGIEPREANGRLTLHQIAISHVPYGNLLITAATRGDLLKATLTGSLQNSSLTGNAQAHLSGAESVQGSLTFRHLDLQTIGNVAAPEIPALKGITGFTNGALDFSGSLENLQRLQTQVRLDQLHAVPKNDPQLAIDNVSPLLIDVRDGNAAIRKAELRTANTPLTVDGTVRFFAPKSFDLSFTGGVDLRTLELLNSDIRSSGQSTLQARVKGSWDKPELSGSITIANGTFFLPNVSNGLSRINGTLLFAHNRATIKQLTAQSGGGTVQLSGFVGLSAERQAVYNLQARASDMRIRYASSVSATVDSQLQLTGTSENALLSGSVTVSRVIFTPNTDVANLLSTSAGPAPAPANQRGPLSGVQLDIHIASAPNLQISTQLSQDVEAEIDLRLRGTPYSPVLLGSIAANQGDIKVFGAKYSINRGEISFVNTVKIEPVLDLDLQTEARGITVDITISGTLNKLNMNYRSDPPLQPKDIIALLTVGQAPSPTTNVSNGQIGNDVTALQAGADTVLGQAISPAAGRLSKLFGITNIKIDPLVQGITNTPQARLTLEQQISRDITVTYVTNLAQTSEQIFRFEWALNRQYSLVAVRDDNGEFGIDIQYRRRFK